MLIVSHTPFYGGAERSLLEMAAALRDSNAFKPCLACPEHGDLSERAREQGIEAVPITVAPIEGAKSVWGWLLPLSVMGRTAFQLRCIGKRRNARLIHANGLKACIPGVAAARMLGIPCVWHLRDYPRNVRTIGGLSRLVSGAIAPSRFLCDAFRRVNGFRCKRVAVIPNGVRQPHVEQNAARILREDLRPGPRATVVTLVAQMTPWKRHDLFLEAAAKLVERRKDVHFLVVGGDLWGLNAAYQRKLKTRAAAQDLAGHVTFLGHRDDVPAILAASDLVVLPSDNEPFGRVVIEAWRMGTPVVVADQGGPAEIVEHLHTGMHFPHGDSSGLAAVIQRLLSDKTLRDKLSENARNALARYDIETHARSVAELYRGLLECESVTKAC